MMYIMKNIMIVIIIVIVIIYIDIYIYTYNVCEQHNMFLKCFLCKGWWIFFANPWVKYTYRYKLFPMHWWNGSLSQKKTSIVLDVYWF